MEEYICAREEALSQLQVWMIVSFDSKPTQDSLFARFDSLIANTTRPGGYISRSDRYHVTID